MADVDRDGSVASRLAPAADRGGSWNGGGFRVGRISGIEVRVHWSLLFIFWLIVVNLGAGLFPARHPDWSAGMSWLMAGLAAVLFFLSILAHELSHALVGRATGIPVDGITLFIFGGVARMRGEPPSPRSELLMTIVGPLTSLGIGVIASIWGALLASPVVMDVGDPLKALQDVSPLATVMLWLGPINIMIGLFNLVPGFPLDGGRVLRAVLWAWTQGSVEGDAMGRDGRTGVRADPGRGRDQHDVRPEGPDLRAGVGVRACGSRSSAGSCTPPPRPATSRCSCAICWRVFPSRV